MITEIRSKSILSALKAAPDPWFGITYNMNIYRGCQHGCIYCDSRSDCYNLGDLSHIRVKINAPELLRKELILKKTISTIGTGSMNDPYMPIEASYQTVRSCLKIIANQKFPVHIMTKSDLVLRDTDIISDISKKYAAVSFTVTCSDDILSSIIEPFAPVSSKRFKALSILSSQSIYCGISFMPLLPFVNDTSKNCEEIFRQAADAGVSYILPYFGLTQRKGQREYFYSRLEQYKPGLVAKYTNTYGEAYACSSPFQHSLIQLSHELSEKYNIPLKMNHYNSEPRLDQLRLF